MTGQSSVRRTTWINDEEEQVSPHLLLLLLLLQLLHSQAGGGAGRGFGIRGLVFLFVLEFSWRTDTTLMTQQKRMRRAEVKLKAVFYPSSCVALRLPQCFVQESPCTQRQVHDFHIKTPVTL